MSWEALAEQFFTEMLLKLVQKIRTMREDELDKLEQDLQERKKEIADIIGPLAED